MFNKAVRYDGRVWVDFWYHATAMSRMRDDLFPGLTLGEAMDAQEKLPIEFGYMENGVWKSIDHRCPDIEKLDRELIESFC